MKRKVNDNLVKPISKKLRKGGSENQVNGDNGVKSNFQVKQFRKKLKEADFITGKFCSINLEVNELNSFIIPQSSTTSYKRPSLIPL